MIDLTPILRPWFLRRVAASRRWTHETEAVQRAELARLLRLAADTEWGRLHGYGDIGSYEEFAQQVALTPYEKLRPWVMRMIGGEKDVLWPGRVRRYAQSSGTSDGKSKYIPVTDMSLSRCHYRGASDAVSHYLDLYPDSKMFSGKGFILGGSFANELSLPDRRVKVGDLSANLIDDINPLVNLVRVPSKKVALMADWHEKLPALVDASANRNVTNISGVPSWFLTVLREVMARRRARNIHEVWPNLEVFFHGGIAFGPYREQYASITAPGKMRYMETYNASEGFFAVQSHREDKSMLLLLDAGVFYEFMPLDQLDSPSPKLLPAWEVEPGRIYALVISACNGLWRYPIGDTVRIESVNPVKITIAGRTKHFINAFGEEVMVHNTDAALARACHATGCEVLNYTAAPVYTTDGRRGHHEWLVEFASEPRDLDLFAELLDRFLTEENSDYQAKRAGNIFLDPLTVVKARRGLFDDWLASTGRLGGQRKVPRLSNDRHLIEPMLRFNGNPS